MTNKTMTAVNRSKRVKDADNERNQRLAVRPESFDFAQENLNEGHNQRFPKYISGLGGHKSINPQPNGACCRVRTGFIRLYLNKLIAVGKKTKRRDCKSCHAWSENEKCDPNRAEQWKSWRIMTKTRPEWDFIKEKINLDKHWNELNTEQKINRIKIIASPYIIPDDTIIEII